jgi:hypothetical protein
MTAIAIKHLSGLAWGVGAVLSTGIGYLAASIIIDLLFA